MDVGHVQTVSTFMANKVTDIVSFRIKISAMDNEVLLKNVNGEKNILEDVKDFGVANIC